jgi:hypothetical protein
VADDRKELLGDLANVSLQVWAITKALREEPSPNWKGVASVIDDQVIALKKAAEDMRARVSG